MYLLSKIKAFRSSRDEISYSIENFSYLIDHTFIKYSTSNIILHIEMPIVSRHANAQLKAGARHSTLETAYSCETGYPFDDSRQIGNTSQFENGIVLTLK